MEMAGFIELCQDLERVSRCYFERSRAVDWSWIRSITDPSFERL